MRLKTDVEVYELLEQENRDSFMLNREERRKDAKEQIQRIQEENRRTYNRKRKASVKYRIGDRVAIKRTQFGVGMKLRPKFLGAYEVIGVTGKDRYKVQKVHDAAEGPITTTTSCDYMKRWPAIQDE